MDSSGPTRQPVRTAKAILALALLAAAPARAGDLRGTAKLTAAPPRLPPLAANRDSATCGQSLPDESVVAANGRLANVVVTVSGAPRPAPSAAVVVDQQGCRYLPHVQAAAVGSTLEIRNSDPILHNVHGYLGQLTAFNLAMPVKGQKIPRPLAKAGIVRLKCDVHGWMSAYVIVTDGPHAVSGADGSFAIRGLPAGTFTVKAWHEKYGEKTAQVTVPASGEAAADFAFP